MSLCAPRRALVANVYKAQLCHVSKLFPSLYHCQLHVAAPARSEAAAELSANTSLSVDSPVVDSSHTDAFFDDSSSSTDSSSSIDSSSSTDSSSSSSFLRTPRRMPGLPSVGDLMRMYRVKAIKQLSQNFLMDPGTCRRVAGVCGNLRHAHVCEIGPGHGSLTRPLLEAGPAYFTVVERDTRFLPGLLALRAAAGGADWMKIVAGDALRFDTSAAFRNMAVSEWDENRKDAVIIGNLPFSISTPLLLRWLKEISERSGAWASGRVRMALTFQHEVAERLVAEPGHPQRCRFSVMAQNYCHVSHRFTLKSRLFVPRPEVDVGVVVLCPRIKPQISDRHTFHYIEKVVRCVFNTRQKHLLRCVGNLYPPPMRDRLAADNLTLAELPSDLTPMMLTVEQMGRICDAHEQICTLHPRLIDYEYRERTEVDWTNETIPQSGSV